MLCHEDRKAAQGGSVRLPSGSPHHDSRGKPNPMDSSVFTVSTGGSAAQTARLKRSPAGNWIIYWSEPQGPGKPWRSKTLSTWTKDRSEAQRQLNAFLRNEQEHAKKA